MFLFIFYVVADIIVVNGSIIVVVFFKFLCTDRILISERGEQKSSWFRSCHYHTAATVYCYQVGLTHQFLGQTNDPHTGEKLFIHGIRRAQRTENAPRKIMVDNDKRLSFTTKNTKQLFYMIVLKRTPLLWCMVFSNKAIEVFRQVDDEKKNCKIDNDIILSFLFA